MNHFPILDLISDKISGEWGAEPISTRTVRVLRTTNFTNEGKLKLVSVVEREIDQSKVLKKKLQFGDTIIEKSGGSPNQPVGRVVFFDIEDENIYLCNNFTSILRPSNKVCPKYLLYSLFYLHITGRTLNYQNKTTGIINLQLDRFLSTEKIFLPSIEEQKRIVALLDQADELRQKRKQSIDLLDKYLKSVFLEMFGEKASGYNNWNTIEFKELAAEGKTSMRTGPFGSDLLHSEFVDSGIAVIGIDNAVHNKFTWDERRFITKEKYQKLKRYTLYPGDVIITIMGTTGRSAVIPEEIPLAINTKHLAAITLNTNLANPYFISYSLHSNPEIVRQIIKQGKGAIMTGLNLGIIKELKFKLPPIELQNKFANILSETEKTKEKMERQSDELYLNFQSLVQKHFSVNK